jgi:hypothetical protein
MRVFCALLIANAAQLPRPDVGQGFLGLLARTSEPWTPTSNGTEIEHTFVQDCVGVVAVQFEEYLPLSAIRVMCEKVDLQTECREHALKLVNVFRSPQRDYAGWCKEFYSWFKAKHGELCPTQCNKFMCKPKCEWLEEIAALDTAEAELIQQEEINAQKLREVRSLETEREGLAFENRQTAQKLLRSNKYVERTKAKLVDEQELHGEAVNATADAEAKAAKRDAELANAEAKVSVAEENRTQLGFALDSESMSAQGKEREARRLRQLAKESEKELLKVLGEAEAAGDKVGSFVEKLAVEQAEISKTNETLFAEREKLEGELSSAEAKEEQHKSKLEQLRSIANRTAEDNTQIKMEEVLREEQTEKADKLMDALAGLVKKENALKEKKFNLKFLRKDLGRAEDAKVDVLARAEALNKTLGAAKGDAKAADDATEASRDAVETMESNLTVLDKKITELEKGEETAKVTDDFAHEAVREKQQDQHKLGERVARIQKDLSYDEKENTDLAIREAKQAEQLESLNATLVEKQHEYNVAKNSTEAAKEALAAERGIVEGLDPGPA